MSEHDHDDTHDHDERGSDQRPGVVLAAPAPPAAPVNVGTVDARITQISDEAVDQLRRHVEETSKGGNRFIWFLIGFVAALVAGAVAAVVFLAISDEDDDGNLDLDVPAVELDVDS